MNKNLRKLKARALQHGVLALNPGSNPVNYLKLKKGLEKRTAKPIHVNKHRGSSFQDYLNEQLQDTEYAKLYKALSNEPLE